MICLNERYTGSVQSLLDTLVGVKKNGLLWHLILDSYSILIKKFLEVWWNSDIKDNIKMMDTWFFSIKNIVKPYTICLCKSFHTYLACKTVIFKNYWWWCADIMICGPDVCRNTNFKHIFEYFGSKFMYFEELVLDICSSTHERQILL